MLSSMYGCSRWNSCGVTRNRCTNAGYAVPSSTETAPSTITAMIGSAHRCRTMFAKNSTAQITAAMIRKLSAGSCALTSV